MTCNILWNANEILRLAAQAHRTKRASDAMGRDSLGRTGGVRDSREAAPARLSLVDTMSRDERRILLAEIDGVLACRIRDIRLTGRLREIYRAANWRQRSRTVRYWLFWASIFSACT